MIKTILWDFDGVIAESVNVKTEAFRDLYIEYGEDVASRVVGHHLANGGVSRYEKFKIYHTEFLGKTITSEEIEDLASRFSSLVMNKVIEAPFINGVRDFLESHKDNYNFYVISGTPHEEMRKIVELKGLSHLFIDVMGSPKSKTDWIKDLESQGKIELENTVFIGDATTDYVAAKNTGTKFILREVDYNKDYFLDYTGTRVQDFYNFNNIIEVL